jgi:hypothetical protein
MTKKCLISSIPTSSKQLIPGKLNASYLCSELNTMDRDESFRNAVLSLPVLHAHLQLAILSSNAAKRSNLAVYSKQNNRHNCMNDI